MKTQYFIIATTMLFALVLLLAFGVDPQQIFAQPSSPTSSTSSSSSLSPTSVHIVKDGTNSYSISSGSASVGTFDSSYLILGDVNSIKTSKDLIRSTILRDYESSPTIGYVRAPRDISPGANPFADTATINQTITDEIDKAIALAEESDRGNVNIKCNFGMELSEWKCTNHEMLE
jgi:hypothetical protein